MTIIYKGGGHQYMLLGPKLVDAPGECRENHFVQSRDRAAGGRHSSRLRDDARASISTGWCCASGLDVEALWRDGFVDLQPPFEEAHFLNGFGYPDGRFRFRPDWADGARWPRRDPMGPVAAMPRLSRPVGRHRERDGGEPYRLVTAPARSFLNSRSTRPQGSRKRRDGRWCWCIRSMPPPRGDRRGHCAALPTHRGSRDAERPGCSRACSAGR